MDIGSICDSTLLVRDLIMSNICKAFLSILIAILLEISKGSAGRVLLWSELIGNSNNDVFPVFMRNKNFYTNTIKSVFLMAIFVATKYLMGSIE